MLRRSLFAAAAALAALPAAAHDYRAGEIAISHPWSRAASANANGAGFMTLRNTGAQADRLLSAASPAARCAAAGATPRGRFAKGRGGRSTSCAARSRPTAFPVSA